MRQLKRARLMIKYVYTYYFNELFKKYEINEKH